MSSASTYDHICITANYLTMVDGTHQVEDEIKSRYPAHMLDATKRARRPLVKAAGLGFRVPLTNFKYSNMSYLLMIADNYERGILPFPGSLSEQPAQVMELINLVRSVKAEHQIQQEKKK